ncbi:MFS general substrate transporter [Fomitiporia mediterranea MF3/22]|uniref:MFS general substrate transporter n=1 Tax=Fomitiporia mediterranea (strain MF3/22) TaxID=694068 RepID=UPI00044073AA|nr:MFS general substrate transporter [Fomitiporia mediterranea MF3/22]EJD04828.1 MFS general substrate transporter [Fomitiporia mediterranea MF3/22]
MSKEQENLGLDTSENRIRVSDAAKSEEDDTKLASELEGGVDTGIISASSAHGHIQDEANPFFIRNLQYTKAEEAKVIRILDTRLFPWILLTTFVLNMDRTNNSNAISDNLPQDLGFTIDVVNTATAIYAVLFSVACLSGAVIAKLAGPSRWIPILMFSWGLVTLAHALIENKSGYLTVIAITEGGVIPATLVYLGGFYKGTELATRLAWFWGVQNIASAISGLMASGLLQLRGVAGLEGWKWLFIVDGIITLFVAVLTWFYLPRNAARTKGGIRGFKSWFDERQVQIAVTRVVRDDPAKRIYESTVNWPDVKDAVTDIGLWGHLILTSIGLTPTTPLQTYLPTVIKSFDFNVFVANALTAPPYLLTCITSVVVIWHSDRVRERGWHGAFSAGWQLVGWILLRTLPSSTSRGVKYLAACVVQSWPYSHPLNIAWMSENTGSVGKRTIASGAVIGFANIYATWASQIYRADDSPDFRRGNTINIAFAGAATLLWLVIKVYYKIQNARRARRLAGMSDSEREQEELEAESKGNRSVLFRFTT